TRVICDVGIAPWGGDGLDYFDGMVEGNIAEFTEARRGETALRALLEPEAAAVLERMSGDMRDVLGPDYPLPEEGSRGARETGVRASRARGLHRSNASRCGRLARR
ncbi:MAG TPA: hypothetical protein VJW23_14310, partial [Propionibacteriaceae bacterium]|nr:hypothetical protein [Propionibacteriaceae bacterium]